jgi:osmotically-inducible protein OsmY
LLGNTAINGSSEINRIFTCSASASTGRTNATSSCPSSKALFDQHPELGTSIDVQTLDHVVYLYGLVDTPFQSEIAKSVAVDAPGVARVVSSIANGN